VQESETVFQTLESRVCSCSKTSLSKLLRKPTSCSEFCTQFPYTILQSKNSCSPLWRESARTRGDSLDRRACRMHRPKDLSTTCLLSATIVKLTRSLRVLIARHRTTRSRSSICLTTHSHHFRDALVCQWSMTYVIGLHRLRCDWLMLGLGER
jgi:hypothetical protein